MRMLTCLLICLLFGWNGITAQATVNINEEPSVGDLMAYYIEKNKSQQFLEGWRVQILATTDRRKLETTRQEFQYLFPNVPTNWLHTSPFYKLQAGAFTTKLEALRLIHILEQEYSGIYPVIDDRIRASELLKVY